MRLERLRIENFGVFKSRLLEFGKQNLVVVYGGNEAGKTTALNGIRQSIFGFETRTPYLSGGAISAEVDLVLQNGSTLTLNRRKGRPDQVNATLAGIQISEEQLAKQLGDLDLKGYKELFGFSQEELRQGEAALKNAKLAEALAGGSFGGLQNLERVRQQLGESLTELYVPRGSKAPINTLLREIQELKEKLKKIEVQPSAVEELNRQIHATELDRNRLREQSVNIGQELASLQRARKALPLLEQLRELELQLESLKVPEGVNQGFIAQWQEKSALRHKLAESLTSDQRRLAEISAELQTQGEDAYLLEFESEILGLGHTANGIPKLRSELADWKRQQEDSETKLEGIAKKLGIKDQDLPHWLEFTPDSRSVQEALRWRDQWSESSASLNSSEAKRTVLADQQTRFQTPNSNDSEPPENLDSLVAIAQNIGELESMAHRGVSECEKLKLDPEFIRLEESLRDRLLHRQSDGLSTHWQPPSISQIEQSKSELAALDQRRAEAKATRDRLQTEKLSLDNRSPTSKSHGNAQALLQRLDELQTRRDAVIEHWKDELSQPLIAASISIDQQTERLNELKRICDACDDLGNQVFEFADILAADRQRLQRQTELAEQIAATNESLDSIENEQESALKAWKDLWRTLPATIGTPTEMLEWTRQFKSWLRHTSKQDSARRELHIRRQSIRSLRAELVDLWPVILRESETTQAIQVQIRNWSESKRDRESRSNEISTVRQQLGELDVRIKKLNTEQEQIQTNYREWLKTTPLPVDWPIESLEQTFAQLDSLQREHQIAARLAKRSQEASASVRDFESGVERLQERIDEMDIHPSSAAASEQHLPEVRAGKWAAELHSVRNRRDQRLKLQTQKGHLAERLEQVQAELQELDTRLASLCSSLGDGSPSHANALVDRIRSADEKTQRLGELKASLLAIFNLPASDDTQWQTLLNKLEQSDATKIDADSSSLESQLAAIAESLQTNDQRNGQLQEKLEQLASSSEAQQLRQRLQQKRGTLAELSGQWTRIKLAQGILNRSIDTFARENEPEVLASAKTCLSDLTGGRFVEIEHDVSSKEPFSVRDESGVAYTPERLSTGSREQLYLAIRMAFIQCYCRDHEPLPVVMDDCFVNFDDKRTKHALSAFTQWNVDMQTIILSCHSRVPLLLSELTPEATVVDLESDRMMSAEEFASRKPAKQFA
ncbi:MAG: AAA family ATPase [Pirellulaceae bacterium]